MNFTNFLTVDDVLKIHEQQLLHFGGAPGIRDRSGLEAAVQQPQASWAGEYLYESIFDMASVYAFHIAEAQAFVDGNKRTALHVALLFLAINGYEISFDDPRLYDAMIAIATKAMTKEDLSNLFRELIIRQT
jgi:death-on-curing protein